MKAAANSRKDTISAMFEKAAKASARAAETAEERAARKKAENDARALTHAFLVARGCNPLQINKLFGSGSLVMKAVTMLEEAAIAIGARGTVSADLPVASALLTAHIKEKLTGSYGAIVTDAATFKHEKAVVIMYESRAMRTPALLSLVIPDGESVYDHKAAARDVLAALQQYDLSIAENCTCLMGDNVEFNTALARELGLARARCLPHALNLVVKHGVALLPKIKALCQDAGAIIYAGGTNKRAAELRSETYKLAPTSMVMYHDRFGSIVEACLYRFENFDKVKQWHLDSAVLRDEAAEEDGDADDTADVDADDEDDLSPAALHKKRSMRARAAYVDKWAPLHLAIVKLLFGNVTALIQACSATFDNVPSDIRDQLGLFETKLEAAAGEYALTKRIACPPCCECRAHAHLLRQHTWLQVARRCW